MQGRANQAILKTLAEYFQVPISSVSLVSGYTSKQKIINIEA
ncbi:DUF167 domain-containing protein [Candidatus Daviesbacteria bacterium]|nr:DUF167 domain-containing protein [Candidatus Daviesbacteria bacterium]